MSLWDPKVVLLLMDSLAVLLNRSFQLSRVRIASAASPILRLLMQRDKLWQEVQLLRRELAVLRGQRETIPSHRRPEYTPEHRFEILQIMRLRNWSIDRVAYRFVLHPNTLRSWLEVLKGQQDRPGLLKSQIVWNRIDDAVRWTTHELRRLCPEPECGTRSMARYFLRAGIAISRSTVQRVLREKQSKKPSSPPSSRASKPMAAGVKPFHLLRPEELCKVWHMDMTTLKVLWMQWSIVAVLDGCTRKLLALRIYSKVPTTSLWVRLIRHTIKKEGRPRFIITDHGTQFRKKFSDAMKKAGIRHVRGKVGQPFLNGKVERFFRTFKTLWQWMIPSLTTQGFQKRLDVFKDWYNHERPHAALKGRTPEEVHENISLPEPIPIRQRDSCKVLIDVQRKHYHGHPCMPMVKITWRRAA